MQSPFWDVSEDRNFTAILPHFFRGGGGNAPPNSGMRRPEQASGSVVATVEEVWRALWYVEGMGASRTVAECCRGARGSLHFAPPQAWYTDWAGCKGQDSLADIVQQDAAFESLDQAQKMRVLLAPLHAKKGFQRSDKWRAAIQVHPMSMCLYNRLPDPVIVADLGGAPTHLPAECQSGWHALALAVWRPV